MSAAPDRPPVACLCLDIETAKQDALCLREIGLYRPDLDARARISAQAPDLVTGSARCLSSLVITHSVINGCKTALFAFVLASSLCVSQAYRMKSRSIHATNRRAASVLCANVAARIAVPKGRAGSFCQASQVWMRALMKSGCVNPAPS